MRLLLFNLVTDVNDPVLGFGAVWLRELARHCESIDVITMYRGTVDVPANVTVYSAGRERGWSKARRLAEFYRHLTRLLAARRYDACFAHMMPLFAALAGPLLKARGIPQVLWYAHRQDTQQLRLGLAMSWRAVTSVETSFPIRSDKLRVVGQGIDTDFFSPAQTAARVDNESPQVLHIARLASIKHQATTIRAAAQTEASLTLIGGVQTGYPEDYPGELRRLCAELDMSDRCRFTGDLPPDQVRDWCRRATLALNASPVGLFDKSALESMSCAAPTLVCNPAFAPVLGDYRDLLMFAGPEDVDGLRDRIRELLSLSAAERSSIGESLRAGIKREHSLGALIQRLLAVLQTGELPSE